MDDDFENDDFDVVEVESANVRRQAPLRSGNSNSQLQLNQNRNQSQNQNRRRSGIEMQRDLDLDIDGGDGGGEAEIDINAHLQRTSYNTFETSTVPRLKACRELREVAMTNGALIRSLLSQLLESNKLAEHGSAVYKDSQIQEVEKSWLHTMQSATDALAEERALTKCVANARIFGSIDQNKDWEKELENLKKAYYHDEDQSRGEKERYRTSVREWRAEWWQHKHGDQFMPASWSKIDGGDETPSRAAEEEDDEDAYVMSSTVQEDRVPLDPLTQLPIVHPVRSQQCSHVYERETILEYLGRKRIVQCPVATCKYSITIEILEKDVQLERTITRLSESQSTKSSGRNSFIDVN